MGVWSYARCRETRSVVLDGDQLDLARPEFVQNWPTPGFFNTKAISFHLSLIEVKITKRGTRYDDALWAAAVALVVQPRLSISRLVRHLSFAMETTRYTTHHPLGSPRMTRVLRKDGTCITRRTVEALLRKGEYVVGRSMGAVQLQTWQRHWHEIVVAHVWSVTGRSRVVSWFYRANVSQRQDIRCHCHGSVLTANSRDLGLEHPTSTQVAASTRWGMSASQAITRRISDLPIRSPKPVQC